MEAYDPLDYQNLARSVVQALLDGPERPLPPAEPFDGAGVYAIYYKGDFSAYSALAAVEPRLPIYVGKAVPKGGRKGNRQSNGRDLFRRLNGHSNNIAQAENLELSDFTCRYLVVVPVWVTLAERFLIEHFKPVWNVAIDGFGNHDPGAGRHAMKRPRWDIVHPGRRWAEKLEAAESLEQVLSRLREFLRDELKLSP